MVHNKKNKTNKKKLYIYFFKKQNANWRKLFFWNTPESTILAVYKYIYESVPGHLVSGGIGLSCGKVGVGNKW